MFRRHAPPPEALTISDLVHIAFAVVMFPLGIAILVRTAQVAPSFMGIFVGLSFCAFSVYRLWTAWQRYAVLRRRRR